MSLLRTPSLGLNGQRAMVIGASLGIGPGGQVPLAVRDAGALDRAVDRMSVAGMGIRSLALDITKLTETPFDSLVKAAGLARHAAPLTKREAD